MSHREFSELLHSVHSLSPDQVEQLRQELNTVRAAPAEATTAGDELQRQLVEAGILSEIKPPITDLTPYRNRRAVPVQGEPVSETIIRERR